MKFLSHCFFQLILSQLYMCHLVPLFRKTILMFAFNLLLFSLFVSLGVAQAQKVSVQTAETEIEGLKRSGLSTTIELERKQVEKAWNKYLKSVCKKVESSKGSYIAKGANIPEIAPGNINVFSKVDADTRGTTIFYAIDLGTEYIAQGTPAYEAARKILHEFTVQQYRDDLNEQIKEADEVVDDAVRTHEKKMAQGENLQKQIERNAQEKIKLQKELEENAENAEKLKKSIEQNKIDQATALEEIKKVRKVSEDKKTKLSTIQ